MVKRTIALASAARSERTLLAAIACITLCAGAAQGTSLVETVPFTIFAANAPNLSARTLTVVTPQFNSSLGILESATTIISGITDAALEFFSTGTGGSYDVVLTDTLSLAGIPGMFGEELTGVVPSNQAVFTSPVTFAFGPVDRGDPPELVVGAGTWDQLFSLPSTTLAIKQSPGSVIVPGLTITGSSVTTYTYTPGSVAVPEPKLILLPALFLAGLLHNWDKGKLRRTAVGESASASRDGSIAL